MKFIRTRGKVLLGILLLTVQSISGWGMHPTHMSVVNMDLYPDSLQIKYTIRLFQDDVNLLISSLYHKELFHSSENFDLSANTSKIENYFTEHFKIKLNNISLKPILISKENKETDYCLQYIVELTEIPDSICVENSILLDFFSDQTNLLILSYKNKEKGITFNNIIQSQYINLNNN